MQPSNPHPNRIKGTFFRPFFNLLLSLATPLAVTVDEEILITLVSQVAHPSLQRVWGYVACETRVSSIGVQCYQYIGESFVRAV